MTNYNSIARLQEMIIHRATQKAQLLAKAVVALEANKIEYRVISDDTHEPSILINENLNEQTNFILSSFHDEYILTFEVYSSGCKLIKSIVIAKTEDVETIVNLIDSFEIFATALEN